MLVDTPEAKDSSVLGGGLVEKDGFKTGCLVPQGFGWKVEVFEAELLEVKQRVDKVAKLYSWRWLVKTRTPTLGVGEQ